MTRICEICGGKYYAKGKCKIHYVFPSKQNQKPIKKKKYKINTFSDKKVSELAVYRKLRDKYLKDKGKCEYPNCESNLIELHHKKTRKYHLCDVSIFMAVCRYHHNFIHDNCKESYKSGYLIKALEINN